MKKSFFTNQYSIFILQKYFIQCTSKKLNRLTSEIRNLNCILCWLYKHMFSFRQNDSKLKIILDIEVGNILSISLDYFVYWEYILKVPVKCLPKLKILMTIQPRKNLTFLRFCHKIVFFRLLSLFMILPICDVFGHPDLIILVKFRSFITNLAEPSILEWK